MTPLALAKPEKILIDSGPSRRGWHRIETFLRCPQLYAWRHLTPELSRDGTAAMPLTRGGIAHVGLAHYYARLRAAQRKQNPEVFYLPQEAMEIRAARDGEQGRAILETVRLTVLGYLAHYAVEEFQILHVEEEFSTLLRDKRPPGHPRVADPTTGGKTRRCEFTMRPDLIVADQSGKKHIIDHKIVSKMDSRTSQRYTLSGQFLALQTLGLALYGKDFAGVHVNCLQAAPACRYQRYPIDPAPHALGRFPSNVLDAEEWIARLEDEDRELDEWPAAANEQVCWTAYGPCPAFNLCRWGVR